MVAGDFNAIRDPSDRFGGSNAWPPSFEELNQCLHQAELEDLRYVGLRFTWSTSSGANRKMRKIDRVLVNNLWSLHFSYSEANFLTSGISDHSPMVVKVIQPVLRRKPFKFFDFWMEHPSFQAIVNQVWEAPGEGVPIFRLVTKLKALKGRLKQLNRDSFSSISERVAQSRNALRLAQVDLQQDPTNILLAELEKNHRRTFVELKSQEEAFFRQKSRIRWLENGDKNTKYFHHSVTTRQMRNRIISVLDRDGNLVTEPSHVQDTFVTHFKELFEPRTLPLRPELGDLQQVIRCPLTEDQRTSLARPFSEMEIKDTMFSLARGKAPGPDGFGVEFFKSNWDLVGPLVIEAAKDFFVTGRLLREINSTILVLIPKVPNATSVNDYRPIACCNTIYKCITKVLANRVAAVLQDTISPSQNAFVKGRRIRDNILLAQELFAGFHLQPFAPKCAVKVDFQKAYDTVDWDFLELVLRAFRFPDHLIRLIMVCVRTPMFSISLNGELHGFFPSSRGLRQGDPMSPYLFTLVMEVFSGILTSCAEQPGFKFSWRCKATRLSHLFFADDVFLFCRADMASTLLLKDGLDTFAAWSGLKPNNSKSEVFLAGGSDDLKCQIKDTFGFVEGKLPVRYLGAPIISSRLGKADCVSLVERITARVQSWTHRFLSFAGRVQLIRSVLHAIQSYWASVFVIPMAVLDRIEQILRQFLWKGPTLGKGGAKVSWEDVCLPREEGGLGIRNLRECNKAAMLKHIWTLFTDKESLWCKWIHSTFLKRGENFWVVKAPTYCSWAWKKILQLRSEVRLNFCWRIGDGRRVSLWFDNWHQRGPLEIICSEQTILDSGLPRDATVADLFSSAGQVFRTILDSWNQPLPLLSEGPDRFVWSDSPSGLFSVASAWHIFRRRKARVDWSSFIWNKAITPRYQFNLWLIIKNRLPTQAFLMSYGRIGREVCAFCKLTPDSIDHLFFGCCITASMAYFWASKSNLPWRNGTWGETLQWAMKFLSGKDFYHSMGRFSFGALCHLIWKYRNDILFREQPVIVAAVKKHLIKVVKDKALTFKNVEDCPRNRRLQRNWGLDPAIFSPPMPIG